jgi:hypothetical protein
MEHRHSEARRLLDEPMLAEALARMEKDVIGGLLAADDADDRARFDLVARLRVIRGIRGHLEAVIVGTEQALKPPMKVA